MKKQILFLLLFVCSCNTRNKKIDIFHFDTECKEDSLNNIIDSFRIEQTPFVEISKLLEKYGTIEGRTKIDSVISIINSIELEKLNERQEKREHLRRQRIEKR